MSREKSRAHTERATSNAQQKASKKTSQLYTPPLLCKREVRGGGRRCVEDTPPPHTTHKYLTHPHPRTHSLFSLNSPSSVAKSLHFFILSLFFLSLHRSTTKTIDDTTPRENVTPPPHLPPPSFSLLTSKRRCVSFPHPHPLFHHDAGSPHTDAHTQEVLRAHAV